MALRLSTMPSRGALSHPLVRAKLPAILATHVIPRWLCPLQ